MSGASGQSAEAAGWRADGAPGGWESLLGERIHPRWTEFSWLAVRSLLDSANDTVAKNIHDLVNARRMRWMAAQRAAGADPDLRIGFIDRDATTLSFLLVGDPGEADASQYALIGDARDPSAGPALGGPLQAKAEGTDFMLLASDVIYPAGDVNDYENAFFLPYAWYPAPILGQPGNHDWYDGLAGFMWHFCGAEPLAPLEYRAGSFTTVERVARRLWRKASRPNRSRLLGWRAQLASRDDALWCRRSPGRTSRSRRATSRCSSSTTGSRGRSTASRASGCCASRRVRRPSCWSPANRSTSTTSTALVRSSGTTSPRANARRG